MTRRAVGTLIVASWAVCMGWLVVRQTTRPEEEFLEAASMRLAPGASFYHLTINGSPIGNAGITLDTTLTGYRLTEVWSMDVVAAEGHDRHVLRSDASLTRSLKLQEMALSLTEARVGRMMVVDQEDGDFTVRQWRPAPGATPEPIRRVAAEPVTTPGALAFRLVVARELEPGSHTHPTIFPFSGRLDHQDLRVQQAGMLPVSDSAVWDSTRSEWTPVPTAPRPVWQVDRTWEGLPVTEWVDRQGQLVRRTWAFGLTLERSPFEINYNMYQAGLRHGTITLPRMPGDRLRVSLPGQPDTAVREMRVALARSDGPAWPGATAALAGTRQSVSGDTVTIARLTPPDAVSPGTEAYREPSYRSPVLAGALQQALGAGPARRDTLASLVRWVRSSIRLGNEAMPAEASTAVRMGAASPEGKVRVLVELARMAGLPARPVIGLDLGQAGLPAHTWVEVWHDGRWVSADPVYGHLPAAASLLRVAEGANARPLSILPLVAALKATPVTITR